MRVKRFQVIFLLVLLMILTACDNVFIARQLSFTFETYPKVDGSTVTIPLSEAIAAKLINKSVEEVRPYIFHNKTHQAYVNLINKEADIIFVTSPSEEELALAKQHNVTLEVIPIVSEAFVFLVNADNPIKGLTFKQIQDIYAGKITNWNEVGGLDTPIVAYQRPVNSGSQTGLLGLVMRGIEPMEPPAERIVAGMGELIDAVASYNNAPDAIGYSYYYFVVDMWGNDKVKLLEVDGVYPDEKTISSGQYPIRTAYYAVIRADEPKNSPVRKMIAWILSDSGQQVAEGAGYVKVK
ncbi:MAG: Phosphate binding protein [Bacillota bacterium]|nr:MAG: Phosphate binding protein [Bacillota bacterium]